MSRPEVQAASAGSCSHSSVGPASHARPRGRDPESPSGSHLDKTGQARRCWEGQRHRMQLAFTRLDIPAIQRGGPEYCGGSHSRGGLPNGLERLRSRQPAVPARTQLAAAACGPETHSGRRCSRPPKFKGRVQAPPAFDRCAPAQAVRSPHLEGTSVDSCHEVMSPASLRPRMTQALGTPGWRWPTSCPAPGMTPRRQPRDRGRAGPGSVADWGSAPGAPFGVGTPTDTTRVGIVTSATTAQTSIRSDRCLRVAAVFSSVEMTGC